MPENIPALVNDFQKLTPAHYETCIQYYIEYAKQFSFVKAIYQLGSVGQPGLSDIDLIVVVDDVIDPLGINKLSVHQTQKDPLFRALFIHDIYLINESSFRQLHYINYTDRLIALYGDDMNLPEIPDEHKNPLYVQIIFDFVSSRLIQFENFLKQPKLGLRGLLVRVSSLRHSYFLLKKAGAEDEQLELFVERISACRADFFNCKPEKINELFLDSFQAFYRAVLLASQIFRDKYLLFSNSVPYASFLQLNEQFVLRFTPENAENLSQSRSVGMIEYPAASFFHYLGYAETNTMVGRAACRRLMHNGEEVYALHPHYKAAQQLRAQAVSAHRRFLALNNAGWAMGGHTGFNLDWHTALKDTAQDRAVLHVPALPEWHVPKSNQIINRHAVSVAFSDLQKELPICVSKKDFDVKTYESWVEQFFPDWLERWGHRHYKKFVELFASYQILDFKSGDIVIDVAGGHDTYIDQLQCKKKYIQNIEVNETLQSRLKGDVDYIESDAARIPLPAGSVNKMACHHSFEHFQADSDIKFIREVQRLLAPGGLCVIIPLFLGNNYIEVTQAQKPKCHYDISSQYIVDPTARITGGKTCGDYARIYDLESLKRRILVNIDFENFKAEIIEIHIGGGITPNPLLVGHLEITKINFPYRAFVLTR